MENETWDDFLNRVKRQKMLPIPAQKRETETVAANGVEIPKEILWKTELFKARETVKWLESKKNAETVIDAGDFDEEDLENDLGIYAPAPLHAQIFSDHELNGVFDEVDETIETVGNESDAFEGIEDIDEADFY